MTLPKVGTRITLENGDVLKVYHAMTDGSGCYVCDNGKKTMLLLRQARGV